MKVFIIGSNFKQTIDALELKHSQDLNHLCLLNNKLSALPDLNFPNLKLLDLSHNCLEEIPSLPR